MKRFFYVCLILLSFRKGEEAFSQTNLVPNPSFETYTTCPYQGSQINYAFPWYSPTGGSPDYFNGCDGSAISSFGVPLNWPGYQYAKTGMAYVGIYCYDWNGSYPDLKEYLQVKLTDSLIANRKYCVSFYVNLAKPHGPAYNVVAITKIGMFISDTAVSDTTTYTLPYTAQIQSPAGVFFNDTVNWTEISGTYTAHGGEKYITIGNFNSHTDTLGVVHVNNYSASYYFIDDVSVVDCTVGVDELTDDMQVSIYPNPSQGIFEVKSEKYKIQSIEVFNVLGEKIYNEEIKDITATINLQAPPGVYFMQVQTEEEIIRKKFIKQ